MPDMEKVIKGLKELSGFLFKEYGKAQAEEASLYYDRFLTVDNALALLKEQEALAVREDEVNKCVCGMGINRYWHPEYCGFCGKKLEWY